MQQVVYRARAAAPAMRNPLLQAVVHGLAELMPLTDCTDWPQPLLELLAQLEHPHGELEAPTPLVLVVGRCPTMSEQAATLLRASALEVVCCDSGEAALAVFRHRSHDVALVVTDQRLDGEIDGFGLAQALGLLWPGVPVILASEPAASAELPSAVTCLDKPWQPLSLLVELHRSLALPPTRLS